MPTYPYQRVADEIRAEIKAGTYPPGSKLPSRKVLCQSHGVSSIVVNSAMRILRAEGWVETLNGVGSYVAETLPE
jgi:DNA-binding GntR family transcriptional regulator